MPAAWGIGHGLVGAERATTDDCGIGHGFVGAEIREATCGIGHGLVGAERATTEDCGIGHGLVGAAITKVAAETSRMAEKAKRTEFFTGDSSFLRRIAHNQRRLISHSRERGKIWRKLTERVHNAHGVRRSLSSPVTTGVSQNPQNWNFSAGDCAMRDADENHI